MTVSFHSKPTINLHNSTPVFNKRIFKAQAGIVLTEEILAILNRPLHEGRSKTELHKLKSVVHGLKDIHKGLQFIKDALCHVVGYEKVGPNVHIKKQSTETDLSCYYILNGSIEATYVISNGDSDDGKEERCGLDILQGKGIGNFKRSYGYEISYTHIAGDYLGLVSGDGPEYDLPPPHAIRTIEVCEFLRIDRNKFHQAVRTIHSYHVQEIEHFINSGSILRDLPLEEREKLVPLMAREEYAAGKVIVNQGDFPDHIFFVGKGRCQFFRRVCIKEAKRLEVVRLGQIEKGGVFGETIVLDGSPCFCSVTSIGQVTCYLINKWAIKHNEHVLNLLKDHQHHFYDDSKIQHYIKDSDVWQSYKRSKITELLAATSKHQIVIDRKQVPEAVAIAVDFGDAKRSHSSQSLRKREPGEPERKQPLFIVPRSRRRSSAILQSNAAAVVKAVLLLRLNADNNNEEPFKLPKVAERHVEQQSLIKPNSAPSRYRSVNDPTTRDDQSRIVVAPPTESRKNNEIQSRGNFAIEKDNQSKRNQIADGKVESRPKNVNDMYSSEESPFLNNRRPKSRDASKSTFQSNEPKLPQPKKVTISDGRRKKEKSRNLKKEKSESHIHDTNPIQNQKGDRKIKGKKDVSVQNELKTGANGIEKFVSTSAHFIVKEIINTGHPKRNLPPLGYQRFDMSMFSILDQQKDVEVRKNIEPNPWGVSFAASKWMTGIRRKRMHMRNETDQVSPLPTPLIVIEEYAPENQHHDDDDDTISDSDYSSEEIDINSDKDSTYEKKVVRTPRSTPSPSLGLLTEENEEDIKEYDQHEEGKAMEESWHTAIHEARDQSLSRLEQIGKELEILRCNREERRLRHGNREKESSTISDYQLFNDDVKCEDTQEENRDDDSRATDESHQSSNNQKHRQRKISLRKRSRTYSTSTAPEILEGSTRNSGTLRMRRKCSIIRIRNTTSDNGVTGKLNHTEHNEIQCAMAEEISTNEKRDEKTTKHERRRRLLLGKIGLYN